MPVSTDIIENENAKFDNTLQLISKNTPNAQNLDHRIEIDDRIRVYEREYYERSRLSSCLYPNSFKREWPESCGCFPFSCDWIEITFCEPVITPDTRRFQRGLNLFLLLLFVGLGFLSNDRWCFVVCDEWNL